MFAHPFVRLTLVALSCTLAACSSTSLSEKVNYKSAKRAPTLDIPPDLNQLAQQTRYALPGDAVTASSMSAGAQAPAVQAAPIAANRVGDVRIEREGNQRWLVVNVPPEKLWSKVHDFWQDNGFLLVMDDEKLGIMETDWAENRAKIPQDFIRNTLGKVFDGLYSTGERDKFRTRIERTATGSDIYIVHRGMQEVAPDTRTSSSAVGSTTWTPRAEDPELETEFLRRLMISLGVDETRAQAVASASAPGAAQAVATPSKVSSVNGQPAVELNDDFDRAWRRVGLSLDRTSFTVEDRDRAQGVYYVRYVPPAEGPQKQPGFFSRLFGAKATGPAPQQYRILVRSQGGASVVTVLNKDGAPEASANAQRIVGILADDLK
ncbi:MAG: outer membrane protein assembly factor BamC [Comamonas sp.]